MGPLGPQRMGIMVYSLFFMGNAGFISSTVGWFGGWRGFRFRVREEDKAIGCQVWVVVGF